MDENGVAAAMIPIVTTFYRVSAYSRYVGCLLRQFYGFCCLHNLELLLF